ncbi:MAG: MogA/MoaB family molybdenum cofactor biosynthesis protein [Bacillota bacterium]
MRTAIITISDKGAKGEREDKSGKVIRKMISNLKSEIIDYKIIPDEKDLIKKELKRIADNDQADLILTTGGTGFAQRDVTPEATTEIIDKEVPGIPEKMRIDTLKITPLAALSRATAGIRAKTLIINLPGSPKAVEECLGSIIEILTHAIDILRANVKEHNL